VKRIAFLLVVACLAAPLPTHAQDNPGNPGDGGAKPTQPEAKPDSPENRRPQGGARQWGGLPIDALKERLGLSDDQVKKLQAINDESREEFRKAMQELEKDGTIDWSKTREVMSKHMAATNEKVRGLLTDDQKPKFDQWVKEAEQRMRQGPRMARDPEAMKKRLMEQAEKELTLTADEKTAVLPLVRAVLDARADARTNGDKRKEEFTQFVKTATGSDAEARADVQKKLDEFRKARDADQERIRQAEGALREVLTLDNEAKLVALGILD
jgi:hypothetical protein